MSVNQASCKQTAPKETTPLHTPLSVFAPAHILFRLLSLSLKSSLNWPVLARFKLAEGCRLQISLSVCQRPVLESKASHFFQ